MTKDTSEVVARLTTDAEFLARKRGSYPTIGKDCAEAAALISSLVAENGKLLEDANDYKTTMLANYERAIEAERLLAEARDILIDCATIMPRYRLAGNTLAEDEEFAAVLERVNDTLGAKP
jgi:hypothetical protein